jgi:hypothetical protein
MVDQESTVELPGLRWQAIVVGLLVVAVVVVAGALVFASRISSMAREQLVAMLQSRFSSEVEFRNLRLSLFPRVDIQGEGLLMRHHGRKDIPPFISLKKFSVSAGWSGLLRSPKRLGIARLEGLQIHIPPRSKTDGDESNSGKKPKKEVPGFVIDEIIADGTVLQILPKRAEKEPLTFDIYQLHLRLAGSDRPMSFAATLQNAKPPGKIRTTGSFGPFNGDDPGQTPVSGSYDFQHADLSVFHGIFGILSSRGKFSGELERLDVNGDTDTPDFAVKTSAHPVHLKTQFHAIVDGTEGDTFLEPVNGQFGHSSLVARGKIAQRPGTKGKTVSLDVTVANGRVEDMLNLAVKAQKPSMTGTISFRTQFELPPGDQDVEDRLFLKGAFGIGAAHFTSPTVKDKLAEFSVKAQGKPEASSSDDVISNLKGSFVLNNGVIRFSNLSFVVPGAQVSLDGTYALDGQELDFRGKLMLDAKLSETTAGVKSFLLKFAEPFFKKKQGTGSLIPIKITGTREHPSFGLNLGG